MSKQVVLFYWILMLGISPIVAQIQFTKNDYFKIDENNTTIYNFKETGLGELITAQILPENTDGWIEIKDIQLSDIDDFVGNADLETIALIGALLPQLQTESYEAYNLKKNVLKAFSKLKNVPATDLESTASYIGKISKQVLRLGKKKPNKIPDHLEPVINQLEALVLTLPSYLQNLPSPEDRIHLTFGLINTDLFEVINSGYNFKIAGGLVANGAPINLKLRARKYNQGLGNIDYDNLVTNVLRIEKTGTLIQYVLNGTVLFETTMDQDEPLRIGIASKTHLLQMNVSYSDSFQIVPGSYTCPTVGNQDKNWIQSCSYDKEGNVVDSVTSYFDELGRTTQSQGMNAKYGNIWVGEQYYDSFGRPILSTMSAPKETFDFSYKDNFILNSSNNPYSANDYEADPENPNPLGVDPNNQNLSWYYSDENNLEPYQATTSYPFSVSIYDELNPGNIRRIVGGEKIAGEWRTGFSYSVPSAQALYYIFGRTQFNSIEDIDDSNKLLLIHQSIKTVAIDPEGNEVVSFTDLEGKLLASARSNGTEQKKVISLINSQGYVDIHLPKGCDGTLSFIGSSSDYQVFDLRTGLEILDTSNLVSGIYRIVALSNRYLNTPSLVYINKTTGDIAHYDLVNNMGVIYKVNYNDWSLNYYDETGNLKKSIQPKGVDYNYDLTQDAPNHTMESLMEFNSTGEIQKASSPDEGEAEFVYRADGQIRYSQNSKQELVNEISYTEYDDMARAIESGVLTNILWTDVLTADPDGDLIAGEKKEMNQTLYNIPDITGLSAALTSAGIPTNAYTQTFVARNVSKTWTQDPDVPNTGTPDIIATSWYSYDVYGRVLWLIQEIKGLGVKTIDYEYDIRGNIKNIIYQKHNLDEYFVHRYSYNALDELVLVETSIDGSTFDTQAEYTYYQDGKLKRAELADGLQGTDYVYTLEGALKSINHPSLEQINDPGNDSNDVFGMTIDYYNGDYTRTGVAVNSTLSGQDSYVGNIKATRWATKELTPLGTQNAQLYFYNERHWLTEAQFGTAVNDGTITTDEDYKVSGLSYDRNGNLLTLNRNAYSLDGDNSMDQFTYHYNAQTNQLNHVQDAVTDVRFNDLANQNLNHYGYNAIGELASDGFFDGFSAPNEYSYNTSGLVTEVNNTQALFNQEFKVKYNDRNHRIKKTFKTSSDNGSFPEILTDTYYVRDASGGVMAIYSKVQEGPFPSPGGPELLEHAIYGASMLGIYQRPSETAIYALKDHLGSTRAVIKREPVTNILETTNYADRYPFGMTMPNRQLTDGTYRYAFQGQEKDPETGKEAFELRLWDGRIGRWLTTDPYGQYHSPYLGMGNNPISLVDPDGGFTRVGAWLYQLFNGGEIIEKKHSESGRSFYVVAGPDDDGVNTIAVGKGGIRRAKYGPPSSAGIGAGGMSLFSMNETPDPESIPHIYIEANAAITSGSFGTDVRFLGTRVGLGAELGKSPMYQLGFNLDTSAPKPFTNTSVIQNALQGDSYGFSAAALFGGGAQFDKRHNLKSVNVSALVVDYTREFHTTGAQKGKALRDKIGINMGLSAALFYGLEANLKMGIIVPPLKKNN